MIKNVLNHCFVIDVKLATCRNDKQEKDIVKIINITNKIIIKIVNKPRAKKQEDEQTTFMTIYYNLLKTWSIK